MLHLVVHLVQIPLGLEVLVQSQHPELLEGSKGFNATRDHIQLRERHNVDPINVWNGTLFNLQLLDIRHALQDECLQLRKGPGRKDQYTCTTHPVKTEIS